MEQQCGDSVRIAVTNVDRRKVGGIESYLETVIPGLAAAGHDVAFWCEREGPLTRDAIRLPSSVPSWCVEMLGPEPAIAALRAWRPDVIFANGATDPEVERALLEVAPAILFVHAYHGACISGLKSRLSPTRAPCARPLGLPCLIHYLPRRCGGLNPITMVRAYRLETRRRDVLPAYAGVVTASRHMRDEYLRYDLDENRVHTVGLVASGGAVPAETTADESIARASPAQAAGGEAWRLLFISRLYAVKGGHVLIDALPLLRERLPGPIDLTIAGDGPERPALERVGRRVERNFAGIRIRFAGWLNGGQRTRQFQSAHLLVVPSLAPEPFGLVGPEAGMHGLPAAAFAVGGIPDWLIEDVNGHLAPGDLPSAVDLAGVIARCLSDPAHHARLREGAREVAQRFTLERHLEQLLPVLSAAAGVGAGLQPPQA